jgi:Flp pilus assembly protein TadD
MADKTRKQQLEEMLKDDPADSFLRYALAMEMVSGGNDTDAVTQFQMLFEADPNYVAAYHQCGLALVRLGRLQEARGTIRQGITVAGQQGNQHAVEEMGVLLESIS